MILDKLSSVADSIWLLLSSGAYNIVKAEVRRMRRFRVQIL